MSVVGYTVTAYLLASGLVLARQFTAYQVLVTRERSGLCARCAHAHLNRDEAPGWQALALMASSVLWPITMTRAVRSRRPPWWMWCRECDRRRSGAAERP